MIHIDLTFDLDVINSILNHPEIIGRITDDGMSSILLTEIPNALFLLVREDEEVKGLFICTPHNSYSVEIHTCLLPKLSPKDCFEITATAFKFVFENTQFEKLITYVPIFNIKASRFALLNGFKKEGYLIQSFKKDNIWYDEILYGIRKEEWLCQQQ